MSKVIAFAATHDPNNHGLDDLPHWPQCNTQNRAPFRYREEGPDLIRDDYWKEAMDLFNSDDDLYMFAI